VSGRDTAPSGVPGRYCVIRTANGFLVARQGGDHLELVDETTARILLGRRQPVRSEEADPRSAKPADYVVPVAPGRIVAIGLNYRDHIRETGLPTPTVPLVFAKFPTSLIGPGEQIVIDRRLTARVDWEVELAVVIGRPMKNVREERALDYVLGYTIANDVSARDLQFADDQWVRGKSLDTFCPVGPVVVGSAEVPDPQNLRLITRVNGETVQDGTTADMVFSVAQILSHCSRSFTLEPGDLVLTGTPWGCGEFMDPTRSLRGGDIVEADIESIGCLRNPVVEVAGE
jgi:2-keto-4-pentenoate hydratase/2-oxohepta-3-ene-1,7-dioic acid hydratase in catechol pathway